MAPGLAEAVSNSNFRLRPEKASIDAATPYPTALLSRHLATPRLLLHTNMPEGDRPLFIMKI